MGVWVSFVSSICIYIGDLMQPLEMEAKCMICMVIQTEIDVRFPGQVACTSREEGRGRAKSVQPHFCIPSKGQGVGEGFTLLSYPPTELVFQKQQILIRSTYVCFLCQRDQGTGSQWLPSPGCGTAQSCASFPASHDKVIAKS